MKTKTYAILVVSIAAILFAACAQNAENFHKINTTAENVAVKGFDAVAYFTAEQAIEGNPQFSHLWNGAKWYFSSRENMEKFQSSPDAYAPQFGGYCSFAVSKGYTADIDPNAWKIVDGKLYLNYNQDVKKLWEAEQETRIKNAEKNWEDFQKERK